ncbi:MAG: hypothetical protein F4053_14760 [Proteobacteria bacterium]|nr:hypothetical protein [Pseudomonadota bacterium]
MSTEIAVPEMGEGITEDTIMRGLKAVGEAVDEGEAIAAVETDKASMEIEAPVSGTLTELLVAAGDSPEVVDPIARLDPA